jgi:hypothetical protein
MTPTPLTGIQGLMAENVVEVRLPREAELEAVTALLVVQLREHHVQTPRAKIASAVRELF